MRAPCVLDQRAAFDSVCGERRGFDCEGIERVGRLADFRAAAPEQPQAAPAIAIAGIASAVPDASAHVNFGLAVADAAEIAGQHVLAGDDDLADLAGRERDRVERRLG